MRDTCRCVSGNDQWAIQISPTEESSEAAVNFSKSRKLDPERTPPRVIRASAEELGAHEARLDEIDTKCDERSLWRRVGGSQN